METIAKFLILWQNLFTLVEGYHTHRAIMLFPIHVKICNRSIYEESVEKLKVISVSNLNYILYGWIFQVNFILNGNFCDIQFVQIRIHGRLIDSFFEIYFLASLYRNIYCDLLRKQLSSVAIRITVRFLCNHGPSLSIFKSYIYLHILAS